ncbi:MAG: hypothetical protein M3R00_03145 [Pseudomonadota bacterium]|nr:hypothetical protein [Pseudomonadota bacterium]
MPVTIQDIVEGLKEYGKMLQDKQFAFRSWAGANEEAKKGIEPLNKAMLTINDTAEPRVTEMLLLRLAQDEGRLEKYLGDNPEIFEALGNSLPNAITAAKSWQTSVANAPVPQAKVENVFDPNAPPPPSLVTPPMAAKKPVINPAVSGQADTPVIPVAPVDTTPAAMQPDAVAPVAVVDTTQAPVQPDVVAAAAVADTAQVPVQPDVVAAAAVADTAQVPVQADVVAAAAVADTEQVPVQPDAVAPAGVTDTTSQVQAAANPAAVPLQGAAPQPIAPQAQADQDPDAVAGTSKEAPKESVELKDSFKEKFGEGKHEALRKGEKVFNPNAVVGEPPAWVQFDTKSNTLKSNGPEEMALAAQNMGYTEFEFSGGDPDKVLKSMQAMADKGIDVSMTPALERKLSPEQREQYDKIRENNSDFKQTSKLAEEFSAGGKDTKVSQFVYLAKKGGEDSTDMALDKLAKLPRDKFSIAERAAVLSKVADQLNDPTTSKESASQLKQSAKDLVAGSNLNREERRELVDTLRSSSQAQLNSDTQNSNLSTKQVLQRNETRTAIINDVDRPSNTKNLPDWTNHSIAKYQLNVDPARKLETFNTLSPDQQKKAFASEGDITVKATILTSAMNEHAALVGRNPDSPANPEDKKAADNFFKQKISPLLTTLSRNGNDAKEVVKKVDEIVKSQVEQNPGSQQKMTDSVGIVNQVLKDQGKRTELNSPQKAQQEQVQPAGPS